MSTDPLRDVIHSQRTDALRPTRSQAVKFIPKLLAPAISCGRLKPRFDLLEERSRNAPLMRVTFPARQLTQRSFADC